MSTIQIEILNPKAAKLIQDLADLNLISIRESDDNEFTKLLKKLRSDSDLAPSLEEITNEVEMVRSLKHDKKL